jgi:hypothetical protein
MFGTRKINLLQENRINTRPTFSASISAIRTTDLKTALALSDQKLLRDVCHQQREPGYASVILAARLSV